MPPREATGLGQKGSGYAGRARGLNEATFLVPSGVVLETFALAHGILAAPAVQSARPGVSNLGDATVYSDAPYSKTA